MMFEFQHLDLKADFGQNRHLSQYFGIQTSLF